MSEPPNWTPNQLKFINLIKQNPVIYTLDNCIKYKRRSRKETNAWENIAKIMNSRRRDCQKRWTKIKMQYGKLKVLQATGKLPTELNEAYAVTRKYFDGSLSFLDPYLGDLSNPKMLKCFPTTKKFDISIGSSSEFSYSQVHALIRKQAKLKRSDDEVLNPEDNVYVMKIISLAIQQSLDGYFLVKETEDIENKGTEFLKNEGTKDIKTCNCIGENNNKSSKGITNVMPNEFETEDTVIEIIEHSSENLIKKDVDDNAGVDYMNVMNSKDNESIKIINKDSESNVSDGKMRQFFEELGFAMSLELSLEKQVKLQMQINDLVKRTLSS